MFPVLYSSLYLVYSRGYYSLIYALFLQVVLLSDVLPYLLSWLHRIRVNGFAFPSIYDQPYLTFLFHLVQLFFDVPLDLLLEDGTTHLYTLTQQLEMEYIRFLIILSSTGNSTWKKYFQRLQPLLNIELYIF